MSKTPQPNTCTCGAWADPADNHTPDCPWIDQTDEELDELVRDITTVHPMPKSAVRGKIMAFKRNIQDRLLDKVEHDVVGDDCKPEFVSPVMDLKREGANELRDKQRSVLAQIREEET